MQRTCNVIPIPHITFILRSENTDNALFSVRRSECLVKRFGAIAANPVATAVIHLMDTRKEWDGFSMELLSDLNVKIKENQDISWILESKEWPKGPTALSHPLTEVIPNLADIGIIVDRDYDKHAKTYKITIKKQSELTSTSAAGLVDADDRPRPTAGKDPQVVGMG